MKKVQCKKCNLEVESNFCPSCGTPSTFRRFDKKYLFEELEHGLLHFESGFIFTLKEMITNPGNMIRRYIDGYRFYSYKPIRFIIICSIFFITINHFFYTPPENIKLLARQHLLLNWLITHFNYAVLLSIFFSSYFFSRFFKNKGFNYIETTVLLSYLGGVILLFTAIQMIIEKILILSPFTSVVFVFFWAFNLFPFVYSTWVLSQFYNEKPFLVFVTSYFACFLGSGVLGMTVVLIDEILNLYHRCSPFY